MLGEVLRLPVYHLDALFWNPGWIETPKDAWFRLHKKLCAQEAWIIDGNYGGTMDLRFAAADTVIFLDLPCWLCVYRAFRRTLVFYGRKRPDMAEGCPERFLDFGYFKFLKWIWDYPRTHRPGILEKLEKLRGQKEIVILRSDREVAAFLSLLHAEALVHTHR